MCVSLSLSIYIYIYIYLYMNLQHIVCVCHSDVEIERATTTFVSYCVVVLFQRWDKTKNENACNALCCRRFQPWNTHPRELAQYCNMLQCHILTHIYIYIYTHASTYTYIYIYIYRPQFKTLKRLKRTARQLYAYVCLFSFVLFSPAICWTNSTTICCKLHRPSAQKGRLAYNIAWHNMTYMTYAYMYTCMHALHACMHACMHTYIHTYITHIHTYTHAHII